MCECCNKKDQHQKLKVNGIMETANRKNLQAILVDMPGVIGVDYDTEPETGIISFDPRILSPERLQDLLANNNFQVS